VRAQRAILVFVDAEEDFGSLNGFGFPVPPSPLFSLRGLPVSGSGGDIRRRPGRRCR
jgi:hypothetical protein